jgi:hypothetical protein
MRRDRAIMGALAIAIGCVDPEPSTGSLVITIDGLPGGAAAAVTILGPNQLSRQLSSTATLENLAPGTYTITVGTVPFSDALYSSDPSAQTHTVVAGRSEPAVVHYALSSGRVNLSITGVPADHVPTLHLSGPVDRVVFASGIVEALPAGTYDIVTDTIVAQTGELFAAPAQQVTVPASSTPVNVSVSFALSSGTLALTVEGLPTYASPAPVTITTSHGFSRGANASTTFTLPVGTYHIGATTFNTACPDIFVPSTTGQDVVVSVGATSSAAVSYTQSQVVPGNLNLSIARAYVVQAVQNDLGLVPMVAGRPALVRVFGVANQCNSTRARVRVTLSTGTVYTVDAPEATVRTATDEGTLSASWNVLLPSSEVVPGLTVRADIDPDNEIPEADETDNRYPANAPLDVAVRNMPVVGVRFVSVTIAGSTGNIASSRIDSMLALARKIHPVSGYDADVRAVPYTSTHRALTRDDEAGWASVLSEVNALRTADATHRYYHGIVHVSYTTGIAGIAYVRGRSGLSWDYLPSGAEIFAHEMGHNFGRDHSPCGNPSGVDEQYPTTGAYAGGFIGQFGFDVTRYDIKDPRQFSDIMGYCSHKWISDYTYTGMMDWLIAQPTSLPVRSADVEPSLLVWGRIVNGVPVLEPAFEITTRPSLPDVPGPYTLAAVDDSGADIMSLSFGVERIADLSSDQRTFAFAIPRSMLRGKTVASLRLRAAGRTSTSVRAGDVTADARAVVTRVTPRTARVRWNANAFPAVMIRDADTGDVLSFARGGNATIATGSSASLELLYSNRIRSRRVVMPLR